MGPEGFEPSTSTMSRYHDSTHNNITQTPEEFVKDFEQTCSVDWRLAESTTKERVKYARRLVDFLGNHPLTATKQELREFIQGFNDDNAIKTVRVIYGRYFDSRIADSFKVPQPQFLPKWIPKRQELQRVYDTLDSPKLKVAFLILASSGLRRHELMELSPSQIDFDNRIIYPRNGSKQTTKRQWVTFYNHEAGQELSKEYDLKAMEPQQKLFDFYSDTLTKKLREASEEVEAREVTPQVLRFWFCNELNRLGVADRYIDAFCGRVPKSVLARHYTDFSPEILRNVYDKAGLKVLS